MELLVWWFKSFESIIGSLPSSPIFVFFVACNNVRVFFFLATRQEFATWQFALNAPPHQVFALPSPSPVPPLSVLALPSLPASLCAKAYFLRLSIRCRVHWLRLFLTLVILTLGGGTLVSILLSQPVAWLTAARPAHCTAILAAYLVFFTRAGQPLYHLYRYRPLRDVWQLFASAQAAVGAAGGVEAGLAAGLHLPAAVLLGILGGNGGALLAEAWDLLLQGHTRYASPIHGPGPGAILTAWGAIGYGALRVAPGVGEWVSGVLLQGGGGSSSSSSSSAAAAAASAAAPYLRGLAAALTPATCRALTLLGVAWANFSIPGRPLALGGSEALAYLFPSLGFVPVWDCGDAAQCAGDTPAQRREEEEERGRVPPPWPLDAGMFGYEVTSLHEIKARGGAGGGGGATLPTTTSESAAPPGRAHAAAPAASSSSPPAAQPTAKQ